MEAFYHPIGFRVVGAGPDARGSEELGEFCPEPGLELGSSVGGDELWHAEASDPATDEMAGHGDGIHGGKRDCFGPSGEPVHDSQQVGVAVRRWKWSDQIDMDVLETRVGCLEVAHRWLGVTLDFGSLAVMAGTDEVTDVGVDFGPGELRSDEMTCLVDARMR